MMSTTTPLQIRNNPANTSTSKHQWSFSKSNRFPSPKTICNQTFYDHRSCLSERKASIGYGSRSKNFESTKQIPEPGKYQLPTDFNVKKNRGFSFTANRQNLKFDHYMKLHQNTPDPQHYDQDSEQIKSSRKYSMRPKTAYPQNYFIPSNYASQKQKVMPGPGNYQTIDVMGSRYYTKSPNHFAKSFVGKQRFNSQKTTPGPQDYTNKTIEPDGIYLLSNMKSSGRRSFLNGQRKLKLQGNKQTPGPGSYRVPSDFGHYQQPIQNITMNSSIRQSGKRPATALQ